MQHWHTSSRHFQTVGYYIFFVQQTLVTIEKYQADQTNWKCGWFWIDEIAFEEKWLAETLFPSIKLKTVLRLKSFEHNNRI